MIELRFIGVDRYMGRCGLDGFGGMVLYGCGIVVEFVGGRRY